MTPDLQPPASGLARVEGWTFNVSRAMGRGALPPVYRAWTDSWRHGAAYEDGRHSEGVAGALPLYSTRRRAIEGLIVAMDDAYYEKRRAVEALLEDETDE